MVHGTFLPLEKERFYNFVSLELHALKSSLQCVCGIDHGSIDGCGERRLSTLLGSVGVLVEEVGGSGLSALLRVLETVRCSLVILALSISIEGVTTVGRLPSLCIIV